MPLFNPPAAGGGGGSNVTVDGDGYVTVAGGPLPFKDVAEVINETTTRISHLVKHPTLGEIEIAITDIATA